MKKNILIKANSLLYRYEHLVKEINAQKNLFPSESAFIQISVKYQAVVNYLQRVIFQHS